MIVPLLRFVEEEKENLMAGDGSLARHPGALMVDESLLQAVRQVRAVVEVEKNYRLIDERLRPRLLGYFRAQFFSDPEAQELVQETLIRVYRGVEQLEQEDKFLAWLFTIARNVRRTAVEQRRRESRYVAGNLESVGDVPDAGSTGGPEEQQLQDERLATVRAAVEELPPQQRRCLVLRVRDESSYEEIAETLCLSVNTVRNHLAEAKKNLRRRLKEAMS